MKKIFEKKITENNIDEFVNQFYKTYNKTPNTNFVFDLSEVGWISNQEILILSGILKYLYENQKSFKVVFYKEGISTSEISNRVKKQIIQIWEVWKIWKIIPIQEHLKYFGINTNFVELLMEDLNYYPKNAEIYNRYGITPLIIHEKINNYSDEKIHLKLSNVYALNEATNEILKNNNCIHPFTKNTLSSIVTKELYENFLDHFNGSFFKSDENWAFMSLSLIERRNENDENTIDILKKNFREECLPETNDFYFDKKGDLKNFSCVQFSFLDFGEGIVQSLKDEYFNTNKKKSELFTDNQDNQILNYAFQHDSSRHSIDIAIKDFSENDKIYLSRGLFDVLSIVKRYKGLLIARSNNGKILYDFSSNEDFQSAFKTFGNNDYFFPGTLITIYIPALDDVNIFENSSIKPKYLLNNRTYAKKIFINFYEIYEKVKSLDKEELYIELIKETRNQIINKELEPRIVYFSFYGWDLDKRLTKKTINLLLTDYNINAKNSLIILNPPTEDLLNEVKIGIQSISQVEKDYIVHPLPFVFEGENDEDIKLFWLGIYNEEDSNKLNRILFGPTDLIRDDFNEPNSILGNLNDFDKNGNLISKLPFENEVKSEIDLSYKALIDFIFKKYNCFREDDSKHVYLCNGNYFQTEFLDFYNVLSDKLACSLLCKILFNKLTSKFDVNEEYIYISVTSSSHKIIHSLIENGSINIEKTILLDNYHTFIEDLKFNKIKENDKIILVCDVIATGMLTDRLISKLKSLNAELVYIIVFADLIDESFEKCGEFKAKHHKKIISLHTKRVEKYRREDINRKGLLVGKKIIRVNPFTNVPIDFNINETNYKENVIFNPTIKYNKEKNLIEIKNELLDNISSKFLKLGYYKYLNNVHPYFFDTHAMMENANYDLLKKIFDKIYPSNNVTKYKDLQVFYPNKSGIEKLDKNRLINEVFHNQSIRFYGLERFPTKEGWKFPHTTEYYNEFIKGKDILILDDGSTTGNSIMQMIDEISFFDVNKIVLLCFLGNVNDHKREFFSMISKIKVASGKETNISIYFASHWHSNAYQIDENPNINETKWLNTIIEFPNTPIEIKRIAEKVKDVIEPKTIDYHNDYKYLPLEIDNNGNKVVPKKDILKVRDEIGKIIGYRFYKQSFHFFDKLMLKLDNQEKENRYKEIELLCAVFIYEPYLYNQIKEIVPDIVEKIELFVETLIFGNPKSKKQIEFESLNYLWSKKDIVHLFFIVFKDEKILTILVKRNPQTTQYQIIDLIKFTEPNESVLNYVLYKLLYYFPLNTIDFAFKKHDVELLKLINEIKDKEASYKKELRKFYNFLMSLPSRDNFKDQLLRIKSNYKKQSEPDLHEIKQSFNHNISLFIIELRELGHIKEKKQIQNYY